MMQTTGGTMVDLIAQWYDSDTPSKRVRGLDLWSNGELYAYCRAEPSDVWPPPIALGTADLARAQEIADFAGLERFVLQGKPPQAFTDDDGVELVTADGRLTLVGAERLLGEEKKP